jgi:hypothetical protein
MKQKHLFEKKQINIWDSFLSFGLKCFVFSSIQQVSRLTGTSAAMAIST